MTDKEKVIRIGDRECLGLGAAGIEYRRAEKHILEADARRAARRNWIARHERFLRNTAVGLTLVFVVVVAVVTVIKACF